MCRWPFLVARGFGKYFVMRDSVRPGQDEKLPRLMAQRKVDVRGLKVHPWRKAASSLFLCVPDASVGKVMLRFLSLWRLGE